MELKLLYVFFILFFIATIFYSPYKSSKQVINAYNLFAFEYFIKILLSSLALYFLTDEIANYDDSFIVLTISFLYLLAIWGGYRTTSITIFILKKSKIFFRKTKKIQSFLGNLKSNGKFFFILGVIFFILLMSLSSGGFLWISNSRVAYQFHREGVGIFYVFSQVFFYISFISFLLGGKKKTILEIIKLTLFFVFIFYFFGSKRSLLTLFLTSLVYYSYYIKSISFFKLSIAFVFVLFLFLGSQFMYSNYGYSDSLSYFNYFDNMVLFIEKNKNFQFLYGESSLSSLWMLVPRGLYPDKPYFYGTAYITEYVYPGMTELGHFIGVLPWASYYLDFGYLGVLFGGISTGIGLQYIQTLFKHNKNFFVFIIFINYGVSNIFKHMPFFILFIMTILFINFLRMKYDK